MPSPSFINDRECVFWDFAVKKRYNFDRHVRIRYHSEELRSRGSGGGWEGESRKYWIFSVFMFTEWKLSLLAWRSWNKKNLRAKNVFRWSVCCTEYQRCGSSATKSVGTHFDGRVFLLCGLTHSEHSTYKRPTRPFHHIPSVKKSETKNKKKKILLLPYSFQPRHSYPPSLGALVIFFRAHLRRWTTEMPGVCIKLSMLWLYQYNKNSCGRNNVVWVSVERNITF